jgi:hypothetical protein
MEDKKAGRPKGSTTIPKELKTHKKHAVAYEIDRQMGATQSEWEDMHEHPKASMLTKAVAKALEIAYKTGDPVRFRLLLEYWVGKPKEDINLSSDDGSMTPKVIRIVAKK